MIVRWAQVNKLSYICITDYIAIKRNEVYLYVLTWRSLRMSVGKQTEKFKLTEIYI